MGLCVLCVFNLLNYGFVCCVLLTFKSQVKEFRHCIVATLFFPRNYYAMVPVILSRTGVPICWLSNWEHVSSCQKSVDMQREGTKVRIVSPKLLKWRLSVTENTL